MFALGKNSIKRLEGVHPNLVKIVKRAIEITPVDFGIVQGVRTQAQQDALYEQGRTKKGPIVTWTRHSKHIPDASGYGRAIDFAVYVNGHIDWGTEDLYLEVATAFMHASAELGYKIRCGAYWDKPDFGHIELS